jgi:hypothetical protein
MKSQSDSKSTTQHRSQALAQGRGKCRSVSIQRAGATLRFNDCPPRLVSSGHSNNGVGSPVQLERNLNESLVEESGHPKKYELFDHGLSPSPANRYQEAWIGRRHAWVVLRLDRLEHSSVSMSRASERQRRISITIARQLRTGLSGSPQECVAQSGSPGV